MYQRTVYRFNKINVEKRFSSFTFYDAQFDRVTHGDCQKDMILKIDNNYYIYRGEKDFVTSDPSVSSKIIFKNGKEVVKEIKL